VSSAFIDRLRGISGDAVPFWEVWFAKYEMLERRYGPRGDIGSWIRMAHDLGMAALQVGWLDTVGGLFRTAEASDGTSHYAGGRLESLEQLERIWPPDWRRLQDEAAGKLARVREAGLAGVLYVRWCFHGICTAMGLESFAYRLHDDRPFLRAAMRWVEERNRQGIRQFVADLRPDAVLFDGDCAYKTGLMVSPADFRDLVFDETRKTVAMLGELGIPYAFHSDGKLDDVLPVLIELGFSACHGCEKQANDLGHLVEAFGDDICLVGNMDVGFLARASVDEVRRETEAMLQTGSRRGRFIAACNTSPLDYMPDENYLAMCEVIRDFAR
jgi:hypothetical protein